MSFSVGDVVALKNNRLVLRWVVDKVTEFETLPTHLSVTSLDKDKQWKVVSAHNAELLEKAP